MSPRSPPPRDPFGHSASDPSVLSRRTFLGLIGAGTATGLSGCLGSDDSSPPSSLSSWPPRTDAERVVLRSVYERWLSWAEDRFEAEHGIGFRNWGDPSFWDHHSAETDALSPVLNPIHDHVLDPVSDRLGNPLSSTEGPTRAIDVVDVRPGWLEAGVENGFVEPLPVEQMPAWKNVPERFRDGVHRRNGETYGVPTEAVLTTLAYDTDAFEEPPDSWDVLWDDDYDGELVLGGGYWDLPLIAALHTGQDPKDPDDFGAIRDAMERLETQDPTMTYEDEILREFQSGDPVVGTMWQSMAYRARFDRGLAVDYTIPREGSVYKCYYHLVPTDAPNPMAALRLLNWLSRPEAAAELFGRERAVPAADVGDELPDDVASYIRWDDDWTLYGMSSLLEADELSARYAEIMRDVF